MKLVKLQILDPFRSLQKGFTIDFHSGESGDHLKEFHPFCLAGLNGNGKSNVLEALANIFYHLECCVHNYPEYAFSSIESSPNAYLLQYMIAENPNSNNPIDLVKVTITKELTQPPFIQVNDEKPFEITNERGRTYLPDLVVGYSSGENEILSLPFIKMKLFQYDEYISDFFLGIKYEKPKSSLLYVDYEMSQAVLLTLFLFFDYKVLSPLIDELGIEKIQKFTINLNDNWQKLISREGNLIHAASISEDEYKEGDKNYFGRILDHLTKYVEKLENCATCIYQKKGYKSIDFFVEDVTIQAIRDNFDHDAYKFFSIFQMFQALNERVEDITEKKEIYNSKGFYTNYKRTDYQWFFYFTNYFVLKRNKVDGTKVNLLLKNLSDGEQQFLHTLGICLLLQKRRALLLLDEPETHFNPDWRSKFINILRSALKAGGDNFMIKDILLTSHSPFIISDCMPDKVIQFVKSDNGVKAIKAEDLNFNTFGASVEYILQKFFGVNSLVSDYSLSKLKKIINSGTDQELMQALTLFGESDAKQFLFKEIYKRKLISNDNSESSAN